jgi:hypothetical protein
MAESVRVFRKCVGNQNPLTAGAVGALGKIKLALGHRAEALALLTEALEGEARKDAFQLSEAFMLLFEIQAILTTCVCRSRPARLRVLCTCVCFEHALCRVRALCTCVFCE